MMVLDANQLHDEAIRSASRDNMAEVEKMTRMNRTLIDALSEEKAVRQRLEEKIASHAVHEAFPIYMYLRIHMY